MSSSKSSKVPLWNSPLAPAAADSGPSPVACTNSGTLCPGRWVAHGPVRRNHRPQGHEGLPHTTAHSARCRMRHQRPARAHTNSSPSQRHPGRTTASLPSIQLVEVLRLKHRRLNFLNDVLHGLRHDLGRGGKHEGSPPRCPKKNTQVSQHCRAATTGWNRGREGSHLKPQLRRGVLHSLLLVLQQLTVLQKHGAWATLGPEAHTVDAQGQRTAPATTVSPRQAPGRWGPTSPTAAPTPPTTPPHIYTAAPHCGGEGSQAGGARWPLGWAEARVRVV